MTNRSLTWLRSKAQAHLPGRTVRLRLTLVYGGLFLVSGAVLLAVTYVLFERATRVGGSASVQVPDGQTVGHTIPSLTPSGPTPKVVSIGPKALGEEIKRSSDLHQLLINSAIALAIVAGVALVLGWFVAGRILRPLRTMTTTARRISASNLHERLDLHGPKDELKELSDTFDELLDRLQRSWDSQRQFVANVSHELRSPLTRLRLQADIAATDPEATVESLQSGYQAVIAATQQQEELIASLLSLAKGQRGLNHQETVDLAAIAADVLRAQRQHAERRGLHIDTDIQTAEVSGDPRLIEQLVQNLIDNAVLHNTVGGEVNVSTASHTEKAVLSVSNDGPIIPPTELERLFRPFERLEPGRRHHNTGHGLGLSIVEAIAIAHGGVITTRSRPEGGLSLEIGFPSATSTSPRSGTTAPEAKWHPARSNASNPEIVGSDQPTPGPPNGAFGPSATPATRPGP
jgi:signal transduction histidine kinase